MDFLELVNTRYAVRSYTSQPVEEAKLAKILEAGRMAPTGGNLQPQRLVVVRQPEGLQKLGKRPTFTERRWLSSSAPIPPKPGRGRRTARS